MSSTAWIIFLLFFPASLGILGQVIGGNELSYQLLALGLCLFCIDQARMAVVDLQQVAEAKKQVEDFRLKNFHTITFITIIIEIVGFYISSVWLGWGIILVLISQIWFNLFAGISIKLSEESVIESWGIVKRFPVLIGDIICLVLVRMWMLQIAPLEIVSGLWGVAIVYGCLKYILSFK